MDKFEISITDNQDKFSINTEETETIVSKMLDYITKDAEIVESSVLKKHKFNQIYSGSRHFIL